jgi:hypothetical protein
MKIYIRTLLLAFGLLAMQSASAATLSLESDSPGIIINGTSGSVTGAGAVDVIIAADPGELVDLLISFTNVGSGITSVFNGGVDPVGLAAGTYELIMIGKADFNIELANVPVPAAVWLFGSALMGLLGISRRKSATTLAA